MTDKFNKETRLNLALRVAHRCSNPACRRTTIGPQQGGGGTIDIGVAAHITAASPGGKRYNPNLTSEERRDYTNGIWLCQNHAKEIDSDESHFTEVKLREWKLSAEKAAFREVSTGRVVVSLSVVPFLEDIDGNIIRILGHAHSVDIDVVVATARAAAAADLASFKTGPGWPVHAIALNLTTKGEGKGRTFTIESVAKGVEASRELCLIAQPGTGKTTSLVQLADTMLGSTSNVAVFIPLSEWSSRQEDIFASIVLRSAFRAVKSEHLQLLAHGGRLALMLDGWNELDPGSRKRATDELRRLRREFPLLRIVVSTRQQATDVPISGPTVEVQALSETQQIEIARAIAGDVGEKLVDEARRTPGVRELVSIPLYLNALVARAPGGAMPTTKEAVLSLFVAEHDRSVEHVEALRKDIDDVHKDVLVALGVGATASANTAISEGEARAAVSMVGDRMVAEGQLALRPQPTTVLDALVGHHTLVRSGTAGRGNLSFQHQQFQEWYASFEVERLVLATASGDDSAGKTLRVEILDRPSWEESILFACERLSRANSVGIDAVAAVIRNMLEIDPMLAAEMVFRSAPAVWETIKADTVAFIERWHTKGMVDRAARFMITTGKPEFAELIWPLVGNDDNQIYLHALRAAERFRPTVLGSDVRERLAALPDENRGSVLSEIASTSRMDGMELAAELAMRDPNPQVQCSVVAALQFRRSDRLVREIMKVAPPEVWSLLAKRGYSEEIADLATAERLRKEEQLIAENDPNMLRRLGLLSCQEDPEQGIAKAIESLIGSAEFPVKEQNTEWALAEASERHPNAVAAGLVKRIANGFPLPRGSRRLLAPAAVVDGGAIPAIVTDLGSSQVAAEDAVTIVGPKTVAALTDQLLQLYRKVQESGGRWSDAQGDQERKLRRLIERSRPEVFVEAWLTFIETLDPKAIAILSDLVSRHGTDGSEPGELQLDKVRRDQVAASLGRHAEILLTAPDATRYQFADLARAIKRVPNPELTEVLMRLATEDLKRWRQAREERGRNPRRAANSDAAMCYTGEHSRALAAIGNDRAAEFLKEHLADPLFGHDAAIALRQIENTREGITPKKRLFGGPDFADVKVQRNARRLAPAKQSEVGQAIVMVVEELSKSDRTTLDYGHALKLAEVAFAMPYAGKADLIDRLLTLTLPASSKQGLLMRLVLAGEVISAGIVLDGIREFFAAAKVNTWMLDQSKWQVKEWLTLLPFSDRPLALLEALDLIPKKMLYSWELREVVSALATAPDAEAEVVLGELAKRHPDLLGEYDWLNAVLTRGTETACLMFFDLVCDPAIVGAKKKIDGWTFSNRLAEFITTRPHLRSELVRRYQEAKFAACHPLIEQVLAKSPDSDVILALVRSYAARKKQFDNLLRTAVKEVALEQRPVPDWQGAYEQHGVAVPELRRRLFAVTGGDNEESYLATLCLVAIDELRDEYGHVDSEPRHPDIESGRPWPF